MSFGTPAKVLPKPELAVLGSIKSFEAFYLSDSGSGLFVSEIALEADTKRSPGGRDGTFYLSIMPEYFTADFAEKRLPDYAAVADKKEKSVGKSRFFTYKNCVAQSNFRAFIQAASGSEIQYVGEGKKQEKNVVVSPLLAGLGEFFNQFTLEAQPGIEVVHGALAKVLTGRPIIYILKQSKEDDGELRDGYNVDGFYAATKDGIKAVTKSAESTKRKNPLILTWVAGK